MVPHWNEYEVNNRQYKSMFRLVTKPAMVQPTVCMLQWYAITERSLLPMVLNKYRYNTVSFWM